MLAGLGVDQLIAIVKLPILKAALLMIMVLPGVYSCIQLHPYEYIYYNSIVGGVQGANRKFELDYWVTSFRESLYYINEVAKPKTKARVVTVGYYRDIAADPNAGVVMVDVKQLAKDYVKPYISLGSTSELSIPQLQTYYRG